MEKLLYSVKHGSHLYGLAHPGSDTDIYSVYFGKGKTTQKIVNNLDTTCVSLDSFLRHASQGNPQALEAMFATNPIVDHITYLRSAFRPSIPATVDTYRRTIKNFALSYTDVKSQRHAIRLSLSLLQLLECGDFNPTLTHTEKELVLSWNGGDTAELIGLINFISPVDIDF
jgi:hypothetical protein